MIDELLTREAIILNHLRQMLVGLSGLRKS